MLSPITPPPTPILEGAGHLVVDCEPMLAVNTPPQSPVPKIADRESRILVTKEVEVTHEAGAAHEVNIDTLDIAELIRKLMTLLLIGFQSDLVRYPRCVLNKTNVLQVLPTKVPVQLPLRYKLRAPSTIHPLRLGERNMKVSDITLLGDGVYELKKGVSDRKLVNGDLVKLQLGGVVTGSTSQKLVGDANVW